MPEEKGKLITCDRCGRVAPIWHVDRHKKPDVNHEQKDCDVKCE